MKENTRAKVVPLKRTVYSVRCPIHSHVEIGEWKADINGFDHLGYFCHKCNRLIRFNESNFKKYLQNSFFPVKKLDN